MNKIKLDIVSDVVCPWCIIGYKRLEKAIGEMDIQDNVEIEWQPFELNPNMPLGGQDLDEHIIEKYGVTAEQSKHSAEQLKQIGAELDFEFDFFDGMKIVNTLDAHILLDYAKEFGKQTELNVHLVSAYFGEGKDVSDRKFLKQAVAELGLDSEEAMARLDDKDVSKRIQNEEQKWKNMGISSVPTVVFNRSSALNGAQPVEVYKKVLKELIEAE
jgi:predicted DsbA family dithiol-disulfide isomerase